MVLPIINYPNKILRDKAQEVSQEMILSKEFEQLVFNMVETMVEKDGIGLAAPQVNKSWSVLCIDMKELNLHKGNPPEKINDFILNFKDYSALVLINPQIKWRSLSKVVMSEGCLSIPGKSGEVKRPRALKVKGRNIKGEISEFKAKGLLARVLQHEIDHLEGTLFIDKLST